MRHATVWTNLVSFVLCAVVSSPLNAQVAPIGNGEVASIPLCSAHQDPEAESPSEDLAPRVSVQDATLRQLEPAPTAAFLLGPPCSPASFALLSGQTLVDAIADSSGSCLSSLWSFDADVGDVIDGAVVELVATQIESDAADVTTNAARLQQLAFYYQIAFFHEFYQSSVDYDATTFGAAQDALVELALALDLEEPGISSLDLIQQWSVSCDSTNASVLVLPQFQSILERYGDDATLANEFQERIVAYNVLFSLSRQVGNNCGQGAASPWYSAITEPLFDAVEAIALRTDYVPAEEYVVNNALWAVSRMACLDATTRTRVHEALTTAYETHVEYSAPWLRAVTDLEAQFDGELADGTLLDFEEIRDEVLAAALPNEYVFDQGRLVFQTAVSESVARELYDAMQEVESQFFRKGGELTPVPGDEQESLTLVIYGSPDDYATYQPFLYGLGTNNGGIFIESWATLFTYDRTPAQSIYTLEELLRHEYVHYLDSRYLIEGSFGGAGTLYADNRLVWYNEGLAEYLAGSSRVDGVLPRGTLLDQIDGDANRLTVAEILESTYSGFTFYRYAGMFFRFLEVERPDRFVELFAAVRGNDIVVYDALISTLAADATLQSDYDAFLTDQIAAWNTGTGTFAEDVPTTSPPTLLDSANGAAIRDAIEAEVTAVDASFLTWPDRFLYRFSATSATDGDELASVRETLDEALDVTLAALEPELANFEATVAWCGELEVGPDTVTAQYVIEGPYQPDPADITAPATPTGLTVATEDFVAALEWESNVEADLAGYHVYFSAVSGGPYERRNAFPHWETRFPATETGYYAVSALDANGNESALSAEVEVESNVRVLVINGYFDGGNTGYYNAYRDTLDALGVPYESWDPFVDGAITAGLLEDYVDGAILWPVGYLIGSDPEQFNVARQDLLADYLELGGRVMLSGAYVALDLDDTALFTNYFHVTHEQFNLDYSTLSGESVDPVGDALTLTMDLTVYESEVSVAPPAQVAFTYDAASGTVPFNDAGAAITTVDDGHRAVFLAFPFADLDNDDQETLLLRALEWLSPAASCADPFVRGDADDDGEVTLSDALAILAVLFEGAAPLANSAVADVDDNGSANIADVVSLLAYLYLGGDPPAAPFPDAGCE